MSLTLITGCMKSGKSYELIRCYHTAKSAGRDVSVYKPLQDTRTKTVWSRINIEIDAQPIKSLSEIEPTEVVLIDEVHMFDDASPVEELLNRGCDVYISGLDTGYQREMFPIIAQLHAMKPDNTIDKYAVCDVCGVPDAKFTQLLDTKTKEPIIEGLGRDLTDDGRFLYEARCRKCFIRK